MKDVRIKKGPKICSDHYIVRARIQMRIKIRTVKRTNWTKGRVIKSYS